MTPPHGRQRQPQPGDVLRLAAPASVQFAGSRAILFRVIRVDHRVTYEGWLWMTGYILDDDGNAIQRRDVFVQRSGLSWTDRIG